MINKTIFDQIIIIKQLNWPSLTRLARVQLQKHFIPTSLSLLVCFILRLTLTESDRSHFAFQQFFCRPQKQKSKFRGSRPSEASSPDTSGSGPRRHSPEMKLFPAIRWAIRRWGIERPWRRWRRWSSPPSWRAEIKKVTTSWKIKVIIGTAKYSRWFFSLKGKWSGKQQILSLLSTIIH